jgi:hypothetical protein
VDGTTGDALKPGDSVIAVQALDRFQQQPRARVARVHNTWSGSGTFTIVYAHTGGLHMFNYDEENITWCYGDDLNSPAARALEVAAALTA